MSYPMYLQLKADGKDYIIDVCHNQPVEKGFKFHVSLPHPQSGNVKVIEVFETREPGLPTPENPNNKNHHAPGVLWNRVKCVCI